MKVLVLNNWMLSLSFLLFFFLKKWKRKSKKWKQKRSEWIEGEMVARVAGKTEKQEGTGKRETLNVERAFAWTNDGNYLENRVFGEGDLVGSALSSFRFQKHAIAWCARCFLKEWNRSACVDLFCVKCGWQGCGVGWWLGCGRNGLYLFLVSGSESKVLRSAPPFPLVLLAPFYVLYDSLGRTF